jgi:hypothetical protein
MVEVTSDMPIPQYLDEIQIRVTSNGVPQLAGDYSLTGGASLAIPATLGVVVGAGANPSAPAKIDVVGLLAGTAKVINEAIVTIPETGIVLLRMPLEYLCLDKVASTGKTDSPYAPDCPPNESCQEGVCAPDTVSGSSLPTYDPGEVFGGASGPGKGDCFTVNTCFAKTKNVTPVDPSGGGCSFTLPSGYNAANLNVAVSSTVGCTAGKTCIFPLDQSPVTGWTLTGNVVTVPAGLCMSPLPSVIVSDECPSKLPSVPLCGPDSSVSLDGSVPDGHSADAGHVITPDDDSGEEDDANPPDAPTREDDSGEPPEDSGRDAGGGEHDSGSAHDAGDHDSSSPPPPIDASIPHDSGHESGAPVDSGHGSGTGSGSGSGIIEAGHGPDSCSGVAGDLQCTGAIEL